MYGGDPCEGEPREAEACNTHNCPSEFWGAAESRMVALVLHGNDDSSSSILCRTWRLEYVDTVDRL